MESIELVGRRCGLRCSTTGEGQVGPSLAPKQPVPPTGDPGTE